MWLALNPAFAATAVPFVGSISPVSAQPGGPAFTAVVTGTGFVNASVVNWQMAGATTPLSTTYVSPRQLTASVPASLIASAGTAVLTVATPTAQPLAYTSNSILFPVAASSPPTYSLSTVPAGSLPVSIASADFDGDGNPDLAVVNSGDNTVSILLGNGDGTFHAAPLLTAGNQPGYVAVGDFNGDGKADLAVSNLAGNTVNIFLGNGDGTFASLAPLAVGAHPSYLAAADFNADGILDLAIVNTTGLSLDIYLGKGDGTFPTRQETTFTHNPVGSAVADFNGDGILDLAVGLGARNVGILLGKGKAKFRVSQIKGAGNGIQYLAAADLNGDGKPDLVVVNSSNNTISILLGNGDGTFKSNPSIRVGKMPVSAAIGDWNGDGVPDLAVANKSDGTVSLLLGNGDGTFRSSPTPAASTPVSIIAADLNGDGLLDLVTANLQTNSISVLLSPEPLASLTPASLTFNSQLVATASPSQPVTLNNTGAASLAIATITATGDFSETDNCIPTVAAAATCTINVTFTPTAIGARTGSLTITDNRNGVAGATQTTALTGSAVAPIASLSPSAVTFPSQLLSTPSATQSVTLTNTGTATLAIAFISASGDFSESDNCGSSLAAGVACTLSITFTPTAAGSRVGVLTITDNSNATGGSTQSVALNGTGVTQPVAGLSPANLNFSAQLVSTASATQSVTLANTGGTALNIAGIAAAGDFSQSNNCGSSLAPGATCAISVTFTPTASGARTGSLTITDNSNGAAGTIQSAALSGTGTAPIAALSPTTLNFSSQLLSNASSSQSVTLNNTGTAALTIAGIVATGDFAEADNCGSALPSGATCTINITFTPTVPGTRSGAVIVTDNSNADAGSTQSVALTGTGVTPPSAALSPASLTYTAQLVTTGSPSQPIVLSNSGGTPLLISALAATGDFSQTNNCGSSLAPAANCTINVIFTPAASGTRAGTLTVTDNNNGTTGSTQSVTLSGTGTAPIASLSVASLTFASQLVSTPSAPQSLTLTNTGTAALALAGIVPAGDFSEADNCGASLSAGASCTISITFVPSTSGIRMGILTLTDNSGGPNGSTQSVGLAGTGVTLPSAAISPSSLTFSSQLETTASAPQSITLTNSGGTPLSIAAIALTGDFSETDNCGTMLAASSACTINVVFTPTAVRQRLGTLTVTDNSNGASGSTQSVTLSGWGIIPYFALAPVGCPKAHCDLAEDDAMGVVPPLANVSQIFQDTNIVGGSGNSVGASSNGSVVAVKYSASQNAAFLRVYDGAGNTVFTSGSDLSYKLGVPMVSATGEVAIADDSQIIRYKPDGTKAWSSPLPYAGQGLPGCSGTPCSYTSTGVLVTAQGQFVVLTNMGPLATFSTQTGAPLPLGCTGSGCYTLLDYDGTSYYGGTNSYCVGGPGNNNVYFVGQNSVNPALERLYRLNITPSGISVFARYDYPGPSNASPMCHGGHIYTDTGDLGGGNYGVIALTDNNDGTFSQYFLAHPAAFNHRFGANFSWDPSNNCFWAQPGSSLTTYCLSGTDGSATITLDTSHLVAGETNLRVMSDRSMTTDGNGHTILLAGLQGSNKPQNSYLVAIDTTVVPPTLRWAYKTGSGLSAGAFGQFPAIVDAASGLSRVAITLDGEGMMLVGAPASSSTPGHF